MTTVAAVMFFTAVLYLVYQVLVNQFRCSYCGETGNRHEVSCPWNLDREERK